jgi:hypothetical protein
VVDSLCLEFSPRVQEAAVAAGAQSSAPRRKANTGLPSLLPYVRMEEQPVEKWDLFISHAFEDKAEVARPLAEELRDRGLRVWYDEFSLTLGDSLRRSIDLGLANSRFAVVIISPHFFAKAWPQIELGGLVSRETSAGKVILPVWHELTAEEVVRQSPILADRLAITTERGIVALADAIEAVVRPGPALWFEPASSVPTVRSPKPADAPPFPRPATPTATQALAVPDHNAFAFGNGATVAAGRNKSLMDRLEPIAERHPRLLGIPLGLTLLSVPALVGLLCMVAAREAATWGSSAFVPATLGGDAWEIHFGILVFGAIIGCAATWRLGLAFGGKDGKEIANRIFAALFLLVNNPLVADLPPNLSDWFGWGSVLLISLFIWNTD